MGGEGLARPALLLRAAQGIVALTVWTRDGRAGSVQAMTIWLPTLVIRGNPLARSALDVAMVSDSE